MNRFIEGDRFEVTVSEKKIEIVALRVTNHFVTFRILGTWESPKATIRTDHKEGQFVWISSGWDTFRIKSKDKIK